MGLFKISASKDSTPKQSEFFNQEAEERIFNGPVEKKVPYQLVGGAVGYASFKDFQKYQGKNGIHRTHHLAKETMAAIVSSKLDALVENKGDDWFDRKKTKREALYDANLALKSGVHYEDLSGPLPVFVE